MAPSPELIDISRPLDANTACWPGDVPFAFRLGWTIATGASVNVGSIQSSVHTATHCDAPFHFDNAGATVEQLPLNLFMGPAWIVDVRGLPNWRQQLEGLDFTSTPRVMFHTGGWPDTSRFPDAIPVMETDLPDWLADRGVRLIGVDLPSVDALDSKTLDNHHALGRRGITIVEGLWLADVPKGRYEFIGLPLKMVGADGSPMRAVLRRL
ncbi:MAG TPA: cyclase family protein [Gemmataceae bacterium]|jgi:arylformamidase|nr:cyclase family protein [Gemmataceae bacterium]